MMVKRSARSAFVMALIAGLAATGSPLGAAVTQDSSEKEAIASGLTEDGAVEAKVVEASRKGGILTIKIRFVPLAEESYLPHHL